MLIKKEFWIEDILKELEEENVAVFAGAGLSMPAGYVSWSQLLKPIAEEIGLNVEKEYDLEIGQYLTPEGQYDLGENALGIEIKNDTLIATSDFLNRIAFSKSGT